MIEDLVHKLGRGTAVHFRLSFLSSRGRLGACFQARPSDLAHRGAGQRGRRMLAHTRPNGRRSFLHNPASLDRPFGRGTVTRRFSKAERSRGQSKASPQSRMGESFPVTDGVLAKRIHSSVTFAFAAISGLRPFML